ncbi:erythrocyte membrane protein 1 [Plasmodium falciparum RAJ116]|uniref:Erythrocyte membrane protein 1 n=2 Tax=Plasmodium falciparum TaxID=5833 RepID=A0A0L0CXF1_PLAFA|nr:erythrocyte membrane protein 1 [Plasmodium falciparum RAJ116]
MGPQKRPEHRYDKATDAKDLLDMIGETIQQQAHIDALTRSHSKLKGDLSSVKFYTKKGIEKSNVTNPCELDHNYETNVTTGHSHPCENRLNVRFSDVISGQCTNKKIKGNEGKEGACAPFRRLHLCDKNLEQIDPEKIKSTHNLLVDVLLAAKYEGQSIINNYRQLGHNSSSSVCTALARSFADIGDIIRGKDLFLGGPDQEKKKLEENLRNIFKNIHDHLTDAKAKSYYKNDNDRNYFKLRNDWWELNRQQVWNAITCSAEENDRYSKTVDDGKTTLWNEKCGRELSSVPTNLDYVPQYLRWFEEWAEEFCRKRKKKLENAIKKCRQGDDDKERYCSRNGYDCINTVRITNHLVSNPDCNECYSSCTPFVDWIDNKQKEFIKQKNKYEKEINESNENTEKETKHGPINNLYVKDFYDILKEQYGTVENFLQLLSNEKICKDPPKVVEETADAADFTERNLNKTFAHTEYCEPCPWCGLKKLNDKTWERKGESHTECPREIKKTFNKENTTEIPILYPDSGNKTILQKYKKFCANGDKKNEQIKKWTCHYEEKDKSDDCVLHDEKKGTSKETIMSYHPFFWKWVSEMLDDSIDWRRELKSCIDKDKSGQCIKLCHGKCDCFAKWVKQKKKEFQKIKEHFGKQKDLVKEIRGGDPNRILEFVLQSGELFENIEKDYGNAEEIKHIKEIMANKNRQETTGGGTQNKTTIDLLFEDEENEATKCKENNPDKCEDTPGGRSLDPDSDEDFSEDEEPPPEEVENPCATPSGNYRALATKAAHQMQQKAHQKMIENSVKNSEIGKGHGKGGGKNVMSFLIGNIKNAKFNNGLKGRDLKEVCDITYKYTNDSRGTPEEGPCTGKGEGFNIGDTWNVQNSKSSTFGVHIRPRRQHICTSNLEKINVSNVTNNGNVNDTFLGNVLLAANYEAKKIKEKYRDPNGQNNNEAKCRALKSSFADIGDIIRGRDMWENGEAKSLQGNLVTIFEKIKRELNSTNKDTSKYSSDDEKIKPPYKQLREDWWEANRSQVWDAIQCALKTHNIPCNNHAPYDDYIPQRLRWMTEWAEWYCKMQSHEYEKLVSTCDSCKTKGTDCNNKSTECNPCKAACVAYNTKIENWKKQWNSISNKYQFLYLQAQITFGGTVLGDPNDQQVVDFFKKLQKANGDNELGVTTSPYSTAAGYIHQELPNVGCKGQEVFCSEAGEKYAFKDPPQGYDTACKCDKNLPKSPAKEEKKEDDACEIVKKLLGNEKAPEYKEACDLKYEGKKERYTQWNCTNKIKNGEKNDVVCIPPRRQKLYLGSLEKLNGGKSQQELRTAFIKCAAMETVFAWHKYKEDKKKEREEKEKQGGSYIFLEDEKEPSLEPDAELDGGTIPGPFKRQLFYSFGDYRDICLGKDIGRDMKDVENKIKGVFSKFGKNIDEERKNWWNTNGPHIWEGMICALSYDIKKKTFINEVHTELIKKNNYKDIKLTSKNRQNDTTLSDFVTVPQFIRWFQEWSEEFCRKRKDKLAQIKEDCRSDKPDCKKACTKYNKWIQKKVEEFYNQKCKYKKEFVKTSINLDSKYVKNIYGTSEGKYKSAETFLDILKDGSDCSMNTVDGKVDFKKTLKTFSPSTYCKTCPLYGVKCKNASEDCTHNSANGNKWEKNLDSLKIKNEKPTSIDVEMIDNRAQYIEEDLKKFYKPSCLLKSVREQKWQCSFINKKMDVCNLTNIQNSIDIDNDGIITFKVLLELWLKDFLEGYYISKKKIETCTKNKENKCIKGCKGKCKCVDEWLKQKEKEWEKINEHFNKQEHEIGNDMAYKVISYCEKNESEVKKSIDNFEHLKKVEQYEECNGHNNCTSMDGKRKKDIVTILLSELKEKINKCNDQHDETPPKTCENPPHSDETLDPLVEDSPPEDAQKPAFCPTEDIVEEPEVVPSGPTDACDIVKPLLDKNDGTIKIGGCNHKYDPSEESYPKWDCHNYIDTKYNGACMPPRRIKLCLYYLKELNFQTQTKEEELRKGFVKSAAVETFFAWNKYKKDKKKEQKTGVNPGDPDNELRSGTIPDEFKRIMFYTFGDYRDICLDTDISKKIPGSDVSNAKEKIGKVFSNGADKSPSGKTREQWWNENGPKIWEAMFCALENFGADKETLIKAYNYNNVTFDNPSGTKLTEFVNRSQFLRWMIEWGEHFCKEQKKEYEKLQAECDKCTVSTDGTVSNEDCKTKCTQCKKKCEEYKAFITKWQREWTKQSDKYKEIYTKATTNGSSSDPIETKLLQYLKNLKEQNGNSDVYSSAGGYLEKEGYIDDCNESKQKDFRDNSKDDEKYAFRNYPYEHETKCECKEEPPPEPAEDNRGRSKTGEDADTVPPKEQDEVVEPKETPASPDNGEEPPEKVVPGKKGPPAQPKKTSTPRRRPPREVTHSILPEMVSISAFPLSVGIAFAALSYFILKKKTKSTIDLLRVINIPKGDYGIPTSKSKNRYIPYASDRYKGKTYIYMEGDESDDYTYIGDISSSDITSSESEYEELDINDIYVPGSPKYKTLIEVVLEPSKRDTSNKSSGTKDTQNITASDTPRNKPINDVEWNSLKNDFISNILQNSQMDLPQNNISRDTSINIHPDVSILHDSTEEKPFITSIHDGNLHNGEDVSYNINLDDHKNMNFSTNHDNIPPKNNQNDLYTGIDLINDSISGNHNVNIYDELLKRKENELFGTNHTKHTTKNIVAKQTHNDPIVNQINLFHKWLDRHRNMCEQWDKNKKEELLDKLKKEWEQDYNNNSDDIHTSDNNIVNTVNHVFNTDVSIQIDMNDPKPINQSTNMYTNSDNSTMDNILNDLEKHRKPYFYDVNEDDITYFDIDDEETPIGDIYVDHNNVNSNNMDVPNKVHIEMNIVNNKKEIFEEGYPISDIWNI